MRGFRVRRVCGLRCGGSRLRAPMAAPAPVGWAWWWAALMALGVVGWAAGPRGCGAQPVVVASYGQARLWLKPYDWSYLRGERFLLERLLLRFELLFCVRGAALVLSIGVTEFLPFDFFWGIFESCLSLAAVNFAKKKGDVWVTRIQFDDRLLCSN